MNLKDEIFSFLATKPNFSMLSKVRYVYLTLCRIFSYDYRYLFCPKSEKDYYYNKILNADWITDYEVVCSTWCKIGKSIFDEMGGGLSCFIAYDVLPHVFLIVEFDDYKIKMDPMKCGYDLTRVKVGMSTYGFFDLNQPNYLKEEIKKIDQIISGVDSFDYTDESLKRLCSDFRKLNLYKNVPYEIDQFSNEAFNTKMNEMIKLINYSNAIKRFDDTDRYFDLLNRKFMTQWEQNRLHKYPFWMRRNENWEVLNLILLEQENALPICYKMSEQDGKFIVSLIDYFEMNNYLENFEGKVKGLYRELTRKK